MAFNREHLEEKMKQMEAENERVKEEKKKKGFWRTMWDRQMDTAKKEAASVEFEYIGGHPKIQKKKVKVRKGNKPNEIIIDDVLAPVTGTLIEYQWGEKAVRSVGKAATGAIVGGVLTGGVGAIIGGAIGAKKKDNSILTLAVETDGNIYPVQLRADQDLYNKFTKKVL